MSNNIRGDGNMAAAGNIYVQRIVDTYERVHKIGDLFSYVDNQFKEITGSNEVLRQDKKLSFSSEALCGSLVTIGIPISISFEVIESVLPLLRNFCDASHGSPCEVSTNEIKRCVLQTLAGLQFRLPLKENEKTTTQEEVATWSTAYVRRYGGAGMYLQIIDAGEVLDLDYDYLKERFIPHLLERVLGMEKGSDVVEKYSGFFTSSVIQKMATEIITFANTLNIYTINYKTLYFLAKEIVLQPPHPWMVNQQTIEPVVAYNIDRIKDHYDCICGEFSKTLPEYFLSAAYECVAHASATILAQYGCMLGVESKYGLTELIRMCQMKLKGKNIVMWEFCKLDDLENDLKKSGYTLQTFFLFLQRLYAALAPAYNKSPDMHEIVSNATRLIKFAEQVTAKRIMS
jgi:hypothetical protein